MWSASTSSGDSASGDDPRSGGRRHLRPTPAPTTATRPFDWPGDVKLKDLTVGYLEGRQNADERAELKVLKDAGTPRYDPIGAERPRPG